MRWRPERVAPDGLVPRDVPQQAGQDAGRADEKEHGRPGDGRGPRERVRTRERGDGGFHAPRVCSVAERSGKGVSHYPGETVARTLKVHPAPSPAAASVEWC